MYTYLYIYTYFLTVFWRSFMAVEIFSEIIFSTFWPIDHAHMLRLVSHGNHWILPTLLNPVIYTFACLSWILFEIIEKLCSRVQYFMYFHYNKIQLNYSYHLGEGNVRWAHIFFSFQKMCFLTRQAAGFSGKTHFLKEKKLWAKWTFSFPEENDRRGLAPYGEGLGSICIFLGGVWAHQSIFLVPTLFKPFSMLYKIGYTSYLGKCLFIYI